MLMKGTKHVNFLKKDNPRYCIEDCGRLGCNTLLGEWFTTFQRIVLSSPSTEKHSDTSCPKRLECLAAVLRELCGMMQIT
jgi:hypothetical protein